MANLQVKNVPETLHEQLREHAARRSLTIREFVLRAVRRELERSEHLVRLKSREPVDLGSSAAELLDAARSEREVGLES